MRISDWSSDVCSSDLASDRHQHRHRDRRLGSGGRHRGGHQGNCEDRQQAAHRLGLLRASGAGDAALRWGSAKTVTSPYAGATRFRFDGCVLSTPHDATGTPASQPRGWGKRRAVSTGEPSRGIGCGTSVAPRLPACSPSAMSTVDPNLPPHLDRDFVGYGRNPPPADWPGGARVAVNFVINYEEGSEYSFPDGDGFSEASLTESPDSPNGPGSRDLAAESMYEYGTRVGFWRVHRLFTDRGLPATEIGRAHV